MSQSPENGPGVEIEPPAVLVQCYRDWLEGRRELTMLGMVFDPVLRTATMGAAYATIALYPELNSVEYASHLRKILHGIHGDKKNSEISPEDHARMLISTIYRTRSLF